MTLAGGRCKPGAALLGADELARLRAQLPDWRVVEDRLLSKTFLFPDFVSALKFTNRIGAVAEEESHHPEVCLTWGRVDVKTWSHDAGGLTENDFILAAKIDQAFFTR